MSTQPARAGRWELADVVRAHADDLDGLSPGQRRVLRAIAQCRTAALGGHRRQCETCGHEELSYNSCRDRHCPKCQGLDEARWVEAQQRDLLPVQYFHIVFTVPSELHGLFLTAPPVAYKLLFTAAAKTLDAVARRRLGATIGVTAVLHTWTQRLLYHPHIHGIVPGGGLDSEATRWVSARRDFFLPVRVLAEVFRGKLLGLLETALDQEKICGRPDEDPRRQLKQAARKKWIVYSKPPFAGAEQVLLGRYAYRIALSNERLVALQDGQVTFRWKDRAHGNAPRLATLDAAAFLRRFLLHVLPRRFVRIRHYGFLANPVHRKNLPRVRELLGQPPGSHRGASPPGAGTLGSDGASTHRQGRHPVPSVRCRTPARRRRAAGAVGTRRSLTPSAEPMILPAARSAPFASPATPALCLPLVSTPRIVLPRRFIVAPPGPRHGRRYHPSRPSPWPAAFPPLISLDQSP